MLTINENEIEKSNKNLNQLQQMEKQLIETESKYIKLEIENQNLSNEVDKLNEIKEKIEHDKVNE